MVLFSTAFPHTIPPLQHHLPPRSWCFSHHPPSLFSAIMAKMKGRAPSKSGKQAGSVKKGREIAYLTRNKRMKNAPRLARWVREVALGRARKFRRAAKV